MLRIIPTASAARAKGYYSHSDYYTEDQELPGVWRGKLADRLGLAGTVEKAQFEALCDNRHPATGSPLTPRTDSRRTVGYDFNFHAPKSVSVLHALTDDGRILAAFQQTVDETMAMIEADAQTRVRTGKRYEDRTTGELVWGRFDHFTSRPVDGVPDPHLHSHCFVLNATFDPEEGRVKAAQFRSLKRDAPFYQAAFHAQLAGRLTALGYTVERTATGWDVAGIDRGTLEKFSRRTKQIDDLAAAKGIDSPEEKAALGARTRVDKADHLSMGELRRLWADRLDADEATTLATLAARPEPPVPTDPEPVIRPDIREGPIGPTPDPVAGGVARESLDFACRHLFERQAVVPERTLLAEALKAGVGQFTLPEAEAALRASDVLVREVRGQRFATTRAVLAEEDKLIAFARDGRGTCRPLGPAGYTVARDWLNVGQKAAVRHVLTSADRVILVRGAAGAGKTSLMQEAVAGIEAGGKRVFAFAPSADASRGVLRREGFADAETVARLLVDTKLQEAARGQVLWVDEAGLLGSRAMSRLFDLAGRLDCRVVLSGDKRQHGSVERGSVLRVLEEQAGVTAAEVKEIQRQKGAYKAAIACLADGRAAAGFDKLDALGWVREVADADRYTAMAADYRDAVRAGRSVLAVSPTHAEAAVATAAIRQALRADGRLADTERRFTALTRVDLTEAERGRADSYNPGDVLQFHQNAKGHRLGERLVVRDGQALPLEQADRFMVFRPAELALAQGDRVRVTKGGKTRDGHKLETGQAFTVAGFTLGGDIRLANGWVVGKDFGHLAYGYVSTSHAAQGKTVDRVLIAQSGASAGAASREQFYVSASRGRQQVTVYTDDKAALREAITRSDEQMAATELIGAAGRRDRSRLRQRLEQAFGREREWTPPRDITRGWAAQEATYDR